MLLGGYIFPHPPIIIPHIGKGEEKGAAITIEGVKALAYDIGNKKPKTIIVITPHGPVFQDAVCISVEPDLYGNFGNFGQRELRFEFKNDIELTKKIIECATEEGILVGEMDENFSRRYGVPIGIDHGALVPLYFVNQNYKDYRLVHISMGFLSYEELFRFGMSINRAINEYKQDVVVIASGDLSHRLTKDAPNGFNPRGKEFDQKLIGNIKNNDIEAIMSMDYSLIECAGECGFRTIVILQGILDGYKVKPEVVSYEGPFGVGYGTVIYDILEKKQESIYKNIVNNNILKVQEIRDSEDQYVALARLSLENYVKTRKTASLPEDLDEEILKNRAGVFVSIKKYGQLRGCIGTISPTRKSIGEEIIYNAISAGTKDPRFEPVEECELEDLVYSVDVLKEPEPIKSKDELDVKRYGVIVTKGGRSGLLLPNLDGVDTVEEQIAIALQKAGIEHHEGYSMERFEVIRHGSK